MDLRRLWQEDQSAARRYQPTSEGNDWARSCGCILSVLQECRVKAVSIESGLSWDDRESIQIENRAPTTHRKGGVPLWLYDMEKVRMVLCEIVWQFIFYGH